MDIFKKHFHTIDYIVRSDEYRGQMYADNSKGEEYNKFLLPKPDNTKRIFILGASAARIFADSREQFAAMLATLVPNTNFEVLNCATRAYDSHRVSIIQKEILEYSPDLLIIMTGNNDHYPELKITKWQVVCIQINQLLREISWSYNFIHDKLLQKLKENGYLTGKPYDRLQRAVIYEDNLRRMVTRARKKGVPVMLCTLPVNFEGPPGGVLNLAKKNIMHAWLAIEKRNYTKALTYFNKCHHKNTDDEMISFYLGYCHEKMGNYTQARKMYHTLVENNGTQCSPSFNKIIRTICREEGALLVDIEKLFISLAPHGLLGRLFFEDHVHWLPELNIKIIELMLREIYEYNLKEKDQIFAPVEQWEPIFTSIPIKDIISHIARKDENTRYNEFAQSLLHIGILEIPDPAPMISENLIFTFRYILNDDINYFDLKKVDILKARILKDFYLGMWGDKRDAENIYKNWPIVLMHIGEAYRRMGYLRRALAVLDKAIALNEKLYYAYLIRGLVYSNMDDNEKAAEEFNIVEENAASHYPWIYNFRKAILI